MLVGQVADLSGDAQALCKLEQNLEQQETFLACFFGFVSLLLCESEG